jgi:hypothetical protein
LGKYFTRLPHLQITRAKWIGDVAQAVECLLCKCKALNSNCGPTTSLQKKKKEKKIYCTAKTLYGNTVKKY